MFPGFLQAWWLNLQSLKKLIGPFFASCFLGMNFYVSLLHHSHWFAYNMVLNFWSLNDYKLVKYLIMGNHSQTGIKRKNVILIEAVPDGYMKFEKVFLCLVVSELRLK